MAVYVIGPEGGPYKIGVAGIPEKRLKGLQTAHWDTLQLVSVYGGSYQLEEHLHTLFAERKIRGEWFDLSESDLVLLSAEATQFSDPSPPKPERYRIKKTEKSVPRPNGYSTEQICSCGRYKDKKSKRCYRCHQKRVSYGGK